MDGGCLRRIEIQPITVADISDLYQMINRDDREYSKYFQAFDSKFKTLEDALLEANHDLYLVIRIDNTMAGFFMLRGVDVGYQIPAFGVYISQSFSRKGLSKLALNYAVAWCKLNGYPEIMLTVHPENTSARLLYEKEKFFFTGRYSARGHMIWKRRIS